MVEPIRLERPDDVFFRKNQIVVGTQLVYSGRTDPGAVWEVVGIYTYDRRRGEDVMTHSVRTMADEVHVRKVSGKSNNAAHEIGATIFMTFVYFSYSAIWRIAH